MVKDEFANTGLPVPFNILIFVLLSVTDEDPPPPPEIAIGG
jgi:hypothetical protein